jgi:hypothetical protein
MYEAAAQRPRHRACVRRSWSADSSAAGRLVKPFTDDPVPLRQSYYLVLSRERREQPALRALRAALSAARGRSRALSSREETEEFRFGARARPFLGFERNRQGAPCAP